MAFFLANNAFASDVSAIIKGKTAQKLFVVLKEVHENSNGIGFQVIDRRDGSSIHRVFTHGLSCTRDSKTPDQVTCTVMDENS